MSKNISTSDLAFQMGSDAREAEEHGGSPAINPYSDGTTLANNWAEGWRQRHLELMPVQGRA